MQDPLDQLETIQFAAETPTTLRLRWFADDGHFPMTSTEEADMERWMQQFIAAHPELKEHPDDDRRERRRKRRQIKSAVKRKLFLLDEARDAREQTGEAPAALGLILTFAMIAYYVAMVIWLMRRM